MEQVMVGFNPSKFANTSTSAFGRSHASAANPSTTTVVADSDNAATERPPAPIAQCVDPTDTAPAPVDDAGVAGTDTDAIDPRQTALPLDVASEPTTPSATSVALAPTTPPPVNGVSVTRTPANTNYPAVIQLAGMDLDVSGWMDDDDGMGALERLGASLPFVYVAYESSPQVKEAGLKVGLWTHSSTGQQKDTLNVVMISFLQQRVLRQEYDQKADDKHVNILANKVPHFGRFEIEAGQKCSRCQFAEWAGAGKARKKPACAEIYALVLHEAEWGPIVVRIKGTGIKPLRQWRDAWWPRVTAMLPQWRRAHDGKAVPAKLLLQATIGIKAVERYFVPTFADAGQTPDERLALILALKEPFDIIQDRLRSTESFEEGDDHEIDDDPFAEGAHGGTAAAHTAPTTNNGGSQFAQRAGGSAFSRKG